MSSARVLLAGLAFACVAACTTVGDPQTDYYHPLRAGRIALQVQPGIYRIEAKSAPSYTGSEEDARQMWLTQAQDVCAEKSYNELAVTESSYEVRSSSTDRAAAGALFGAALAEPGGAVLSVLPQRKVAVKKGYAICDKANITPENAIEIIREKGRPIK